ncbi:hypothetical protein, partial [Escherichia coli]|uniref:hypothetical protein n=1 Tax=Escherichia coli TaxID=562 RepID=UPI001D13A04D
RLRLAAEPQTGRREVSALTDARKTLAYDFFRILRAPQTTHIFLSIAPLQKRKATSGGLAIQLKVAPGTQTVPSMEYLKGDPSVPGM